MSEKKSDERWKNVFFIILFVIIVGFAYSYFTPNSDKLRDYTYCVDRCVTDTDSCIFRITRMYDTNNNYFISESSVDRCVSDLESCVTDCEIEYGD